MYCGRSPFRSTNLSILHVSGSKGSGLMPRCVLQGHRCLSLQWLQLSQQGQTAGHHVSACISMPYERKDRCSQCLREVTWWGIKVPWQHIRPKPWTLTQVATESQLLPMTHNRECVYTYTVSPIGPLNGCAIKLLSWGSTPNKNLNTSNDWGHTWAS